MQRKKNSCKDENHKHHVTTLNAYVTYTRFHVKLSKIKTFSCTNLRQQGKLTYAKRGHAETEGKRRLPALDQGTLFMHAHAKIKHKHHVSVLKKLTARPKTKS